MKKVTNQEQYQHLVRVMKSNPEIAKGFTTDSPSDSSSFWERTSVELNSLGPPDRTAKEWRKVWTDYKSFVKKKLSHNKRECNSTGGGPYKKIKLSSLEEDVSALLNLSETVTGVTGRSFGINIVNNEETPEIRDLTENNADSEVIYTVQGTNENETTRKTPKKRLKSTAEHPKTMVSLIEKQLKKLDAIVEKNEEIAQNVKKIYKALEKSNVIQNKMLKVQADAVRENHRHNVQMEMLMREKLEIKKQILDL